MSERATYYSPRDPLPDSALRAIQYIDELAQREPLEDDEPVVKRKRRKMNNGTILSGGRVKTATSIVPRLDVVVLKPRAPRAGNIALPESMIMEDSRKCGIVVAIGPDVNTPKPGQSEFEPIAVGDEVIVSKVLDVIPDHGGEVFLLCPSSAVLGKILREH